MEKEILNTVRDTVQEIMGTSYSVMPEKVQKKNDTMLQAFMIHKEGEDVALAVYIDSIISSVKEGKSSVADAAQEIVHVYKEGKLTRIHNVNTIFERKAILDGVIYDVIGLERNRAYLADKPFRKFLDLAVIYEMVVDKNDDGIYTVVITDKMCQAHSIGLDELEEAARNNTKTLGFRIQSLSQIMAEMCNQPLVSDDPCPLWVCTNESVVRGAYVLLYKEIFAELAKNVGEDLIILPSSVNEVLALGASKATASDDLSAIVKQVNTSVVSNDEILSDSVYWYSRKTGEISIAR